jgi:hypothetical protein
MAALVPALASPRKKNLRTGASEPGVGGAFRSNAANGLRGTQKDQTHDHRHPRRPDRPHPAEPAARRDDLLRSLTEEATPMTFETLIALILFVQLTLPIAALGVSEA